MTSPAAALPNHLLSASGPHRIRTDKTAHNGQIAGHTSKALDAYVAATVATSPKSIDTVNDGEFLFLKIETLAGAAARGAKNPKAPAWVFKYTAPGGVQKTRQFGTLPTVQVGDARKAAQEQRAILTKAKLEGGACPATANRQFKDAQKALFAEDKALRAAEAGGPAAPGTFGHWFEAFFAFRTQHAWKTVEHGKSLRSTVEKYWGNRAGRVNVKGQPIAVDPVLAPLCIWHRRLKDIKKSDLLKVTDVLLNREKPMWETASDAVEAAGQVFKFANDRIHGQTHNPAKEIQEGDLFKLKPANKNHPQLETPKQLGQLIRALEADVEAGFADGAGWHARCHAQQAAACLLQIYTFQRPTNVARIRWEHIDGKRNQWLIPAQEMKINHNDAWTHHSVPLSLSALTLLVKLAKVNPPVAGKAENYVFEGTCAEGGIITGTMLKAIKRHGFDDVLDNHGLRGTAQTFLHNILGISSDWTDAHLAHCKKGANKDTYDKAMYPKQRVGMIKRWDEEIVVPAKNGLFEVWEAEEEAALEESSTVTLDKLLRGSVVKLVQPEKLAA